MATTIVDDTPDGEKRLVYLVLNLFKFATNVSILMLVHEVIHGIFDCFFLSLTSILLENLLGNHGNHILNINLSGKSSSCIFKRALNLSRELVDRFSRLGLKSNP
jgi:hypothetical protein